MAEMRLIDVNDVYKIIGQTGTARVHVADIDQIKRIAPETLPIVQELREKLEREKRLCDDLQKYLAVTANERDAALERVKHYAGCWECKVREEGECAMPFFKDECSDWEWRGPGGDRP